MPKTDARPRPRPLIFVVHDEVARLDLVPVRVPREPRRAEILEAPEHDDSTERVPDRLDGVQHQVGDDLLDLAAVPLDGGQPRIESLDDVDRPRYAAA